MVPDNKENLMQLCNTVFSIFLLIYTLCHLLESPHRGDSNGMSQSIVSWIVKKISKILSRFLFYLSLVLALHIILADLYFSALCP